MKKSIKINFVDFWHGFDKSNNYFFNLLKDKFNVEISNSPDYLFYSLFGNEHLKYNCTKISYHGENVAPTFINSSNIGEGCHYSFSFDYMDDDRNYRLPHYLLYDGYYDLNKPKSIDTQFKEMHSEWIKRADNPDLIKTYVAVNWKDHADQLRDYLKNDFLVTLNTDRIGVCYPSYQLSSNLGIKMGECKDDDIVIFASDDFMAPQGWDTYLINKLNDRVDSLMCRDGYQLPDSSNMLHPCITIPIMKYSCLKRLNMTIYHPAYNHMFSDCELYNNLKDLDLLYDDRLYDETTFEHLHYAAGKRNIDDADRAYNNKWKDDELTWIKRKMMSVEERLKV